MGDCWIKRHCLQTLILLSFYGMCFTRIECQHITRLQKLAYLTSNKTTKVHFMFLILIFLSISQSSNFMISCFYNIKKLPTNFLNTLKGELKPKNFVHSNQHSNFLASFHFFNVDECVLDTHKGFMS